MTVEKLIERLDHCRAINKNQWVSRCPAHPDNSPSLSIEECPDGRLLIHCHAGCGANDVVQAVGLDMSVLFPPHNNCSE